MKSGEERCDVRIWSAECKHEGAAQDRDKYLCVSCGKLPVLTHEVRHDIYSYVSGDYSRMS